MSAARQLVDEMYDHGVDLVVENGMILYRSSRPIPSDMVVRLRRHKSAVIDLLDQQQRKQGKALLVNGELRKAGSWAPGAMLDALLSLGADDKTIKRYINPIGAPGEWRRWQKIKETRREHEKDN